MILDVKKNIHDSQEEVKISTLTGIWKKLISTLVDDVEVVKPSVEEVTTDVVKIIQKLGLGVDPKDVTDNLMRKTMTS